MTRLSASPAGCFGARAFQFFSRRCRCASRRSSERASSGHDPRSVCGPPFTSGCFFAAATVGAKSEPREASSKAPFLLAFKTSRSVGEESAPGGARLFLAPRWDVRAELRSEAVRMISPPNVPTSLVPLRRGDPSDPGPKSFSRITLRRFARSILSASYDFF